MTQRAEDGTPKGPEQFFGATIRVGIKARARARITARIMPYCDDAGNLSPSTVTANLEDWTEDCFAILGDLLVAVDGRFSELVGGDVEPVPSDREKVADWLDEYMEDGWLTPFTLQAVNALFLSRADRGNSRPPQD